MTLSSQTEMIITEREASAMPGKAGAKILKFLGVKVISEKTISILSTWMHWLYGAAWGVVFRILILFNMSLFTTFIIYWLLVWSAGQVLLPAMDISQPAWKYGSKALMIDLWHHFVYALGTVLGWVWIGAAI